MYPPPTIRDVLRVITPLAKIPRPEGDNEGDSINSESIMRDLTPKQREEVLFAEEILHEYTRHADGQPIRKSVNALTRNGFYTSLHEDQYDPCRIVGQTSVGAWNLDLSDPSSEHTDD